MFHHICDLQMKLQKKPLVWRIHENHEENTKGRDAASQGGKKPLCAMLLAQAGAGFMLLEFPSCIPQPQNAKKPLWASWCAAALHCAVGVPWCTTALCLARLGHPQVSEALHYTVAQELLAPQSCIFFSSLPHTLIHACFYPLFLASLSLYHTASLSKLTCTSFLGPPRSHEKPLCSLLGMCTASYLMICMSFKL